MINFLFGALSAAVVFTFFSTLGLKISGLVRRAWTALRQWFGPRTDIE